MPWYESCLAGVQGGQDVHNFTPDMVKTLDYDIIFSMAVGFSHANAKDPYSCTPHPTPRPQKKEGGERSGAALRIPFYLYIHNRATTSH